MGFEGDGRGDLKFIYRIGLKPLPLEWNKSFYTNPLGFDKQIHIGNEVNIRSDR